MALSRRIRKQEQTRLVVGRGKTALAAACSAALLASAWTWGDGLTFSVLTTILFWGVLLADPYGIRSHLPGLNSSSPLVRALAPLLYLLLILTVIAVIGD
jgi:hypothetical protein